MGRKTRIAFSSVDFQPLKVVFHIYEEIDFASMLGTQIDQKILKGGNGNRLIIVGKVFWEKYSSANISLWSTLFSIL